MSLDQRVQDTEMIMPCQEIEPEVESDLVAEIAAHLANELHRDIGRALAVAVKVEKFGTWPTWGSTPEPIRPTPEMLSWVRSRTIAWAKSKDKQQGERP